MDNKKDLETVFYLVREINEMVEKLIVDLRIPVLEQPKLRPEASRLDIIITLLLFTKERLEVLTDELKKI